MADYNSSLPIRTETNGDAAVKVVDGTVTSQALAIDSSGRVTIKAQDGAGNALTSQANGGQQALDVGINVGGVQIDPRDIRALTNADVVTAEQGAPGTAANGWFVKVTDGTDTLAISAAGEASVAVTAALPAGNNNIGDVDANMRDGAGTALTSTLVNSKQSLDVTTTAHGVDGSAKPFSAVQVGGSDGTNLQTLSTDTNGQLKVNLFDEAGAAFSGANPLPVSIAATATGDEVLDFKQASAIAAAASDTHSYAVSSGTTLTLQQIVASGSGKIKVAISLGPTGSEVLKAVLFNSTSNPNVAYTFAAPQQLDDTMSVKVVVTNLDKQAQDLYSTIEGFEA